MMTNVSKDSKTFTKHPYTFSIRQQTADYPFPSRSNQPMSGQQRDVQTSFHGFQEFGDV